MQHSLKFVFIASVIVTIISTGSANAFWGKDKDNKKKLEKNIESGIEKNTTSGAKDENKLVQLDSLEQSFLKSVRRRQMLAVTVLKLQSRLKNDDEKEKKEITEQMDKAQKELAVLNVAMDVIFSPVKPRQYEYNPVKSTVYVKVGNIEQVFVRAVQLRDKLLQAVQEQQKKLDKTKDDEAKKTIQRGIDNLQRQYQTVVASLQLIFEIVPQRNYLYNPKDSTLYLKVTEEEGKKIQKKIDEISKKGKDK